MNHRKERFIKCGIVIPLVIAVIITALFFVTYNIALKSYVFKDREFLLSAYSYAEVQEAEQLNIISDNHKIHKSELPVYNNNTIIGSAVVKGSRIPIILRGNEINSADRLNMTAFSKLPGEMGGVYLSCSKKDADAVKMLSEGDIISIETYYGVFDYEMRESLLIGSESSLSKCSDSYSKSIVIYTDSSSGYGLSDNYYAVIAELVSDDVVVE